jgi:hypothetical protein
MDQKRAARLPDDCGAGQNAGSSKQEMPRSLLPGM